MFSFVKLFAVALLSAAVLAPVGAADAPKRGGKLVMAIQQTPRHLNPAVQSGTATGVPGAQLFASPLRYDEGWNPQPYLAESWQVSGDGLSVTLNLVRNARFHDGHPITSEDVAFSVETVKANHPFKSMFAPVERVDIRRADRLGPVVGQVHVVFGPGGARAVEVLPPLDGVLRKRTTQGVQVVVSVDVRRVGGSHGYEVLDDHAVASEDEEEHHGDEGAEARHGDEERSVGQLIGRVRFSHGSVS